MDLNGFKLKQNEHNRMMGGLCERMELIYFYLHAKNDTQTDVTCTAKQIA